MRHTKKGRPFADRKGNPPPAKNMLILRGVTYVREGGILMNLLSKALNRVLRLFGRKLPPEDDPYSYVMAPKKPRPPYRSAAAVAEPPE
jgi:hypothetical protein